MFERFTEKARRVIFFARYEASQFGSPSIDSEHLLLGIVREAPNLLPSLSPAATAESIREQVEEQAPLREKFSTALDIPFSETARKALNSAVEEADRMNERNVSPRHLLIGVLLEEKSLAQKILTELGVTLEAARQKERADEGTSPRPVHPRVTGMPVPNEDFQKALGDAVEQARLLRSMAAGPEHLLLGLLRNESSLAARILRDAGLDLAGVRRKLEGVNAQAGVNLEQLSDLRTPWCIHVAATLRIADHVAKGIDRIDQLAAAAGCDPYALHRVLSHLAAKGVFEEPEPGRFVLNDVARALSDPMQRIGLDLEGIGGRFAHAWGTLLAWVRTGKPAYQQVFGLPFWEDLDAHPDVASSFDALIGPTGHGTPSADFQITGGWEPVRTVVDVGGGTGAMLAGILRRWPQISGTLLDLPRTVALSGETFQAAGVSDRVTTVGRSFFEPLPPGADLYLLRGILNDWPDREATMILARCAEAARPAGRVVVLKGIGPVEAPGGLAIEMLLVGGRHRTVAEFQALAREAGLEVVAAGQQPSGYFVVECRPS